MPCLTRIFHVLTKENQKMSTYGAFIMLLQENHKLDWSSRQSKPKEIHSGNTFVNRAEHMPKGWKTFPVADKMQNMCCPEARTTFSQPASTCFRWPEIPLEWMGNIQNLNNQTFPGVLPPNPRLAGHAGVCLWHPVQPRQYPGAHPQGHEESREHDSHWHCRRWLSCYARVYPLHHLHEPTRHGK